MKAKVIILNICEAIIFLEDGGTSDIYHNGDNMAIQFWQTRLTKEDNFDFDTCHLVETGIDFTNVSNGKSYIEDRPEYETEITLDCIESAIIWHGQEIEELIIYDLFK